MAKTESDPQTDRLNLKGQSLRDPPPLAQFTQLHRLDLSKTTGLRDLRFTAPVSSTLTWLSLQGSDIRSLDGLEKLTGLLETKCGPSLPKSIRKLASLQTLIAKEAGLTDLAHVHKLRSLTTLVISDNLLGSLPASLSSLVNLTKLSAARCGLTTLPDLSALTQLTELRLSHNPLGSLPAHMSSWGGLQTVALGSCGLSSYKDLEPLRAHSRLFNLDVHDNAFAAAANAEGFDKYKSKMIRLLPSLRILDGHRFDEAFLARKARKAAHAAETGEGETTKKRKSADESGKKTRPRIQEEEPASLLGDGSLLTTPIEEPVEEPPVPPTAASNAPQRTSVVSVVEIKQSKRSKKAAAADQAQLDALLGVKKVAAEDDNGLGLAGW